MAGPQAMLLDLLMAVMDSLSVWVGAASDRQRGLDWRDAVTARMRELPTYRPYEELVREAAADLRLPSGAAEELIRRWSGMEPWPDAAAIDRVRLPYAFVTNCSTSLAEIAARRSRLGPRFTLSAEDSGAFKPSRSVYLDACRRIGAPPERTLFVAGSPYDAEGARRAGLQARLVIRRPDQPRPASDIPMASNLDALLRVE